MTDSVRQSIYDAIASIRLIDPHTHINPLAPASSTLADLLGYHYYTELAHSAGMPKDQIEEDGISPRELVQRLACNLSPIENTAQYRWLIEICRRFFGFEGDRLDESNWEQVYDSAERQMSLADWPQMVLDQSNVEAVFLTNDFDDALTGFDTDTYIPCLRTDDLVFHFAHRPNQQRLTACSGVELDGSLRSLREALKQRFDHFVAHGARACAISLPPSFEPTPISDGRATTALEHVLRKGTLADKSHQAALSRRVFWTLAELCDEYGLPFDLMIGVNRGVYADGVYQGQDLFDSRVSLIQYRELFNAFPNVKFPISVLASVTNQELVSYAWLFPNVITNGHWWYSNTPSFIARDAAARLEAVPQTKQIAYYSDAYKLEFVWPKFDMYRHVLASILADQFVVDRGWSEERAIELGRQVLRDNVDEIFPKPIVSEREPEVDPLADTWPQGVIQTDSEAGSEIKSFSNRAELSSEPANDNFWEDEDVDTDRSGHADGNETTNETIRIETVLEEDGEVETILMEPDQPNDGEPGFDESPTEVELRDTDQGEDRQVDPIGGPPPSQAAYETIIESPDMESPQLDDPTGADLDPLPSADEIQAVDVEDVELVSPATERSGPEARDIEAEAEPEPLDVGDLLSDDEAVETSDPEIRLLRGEESFELGEESLQLQPDPLTGELRMRIPSGDDPNVDSEDAAGQEELRLESPSESTGQGKETLGLEELIEATDEPDESADKADPPGEPQSPPDDDDDDLFLNL